MKIALGGDSAGKPLIDVIEAHLKSKAGLEVTNLSQPGFYADLSAAIRRALRLDRECCLRRGHSFSWERSTDQFLVALVAEPQSGSPAVKAGGLIYLSGTLSQDDKGAMVMKEVPGTEFTIPAQLVLLAMGFVHPVHEGMLKNLGVDLDQRGNVRANMQDYKTSLPNVFSAGDMRRGQSLVVWAIREGRLCARAIDQYLMGSTTLPR